MHPLNPYHQAVPDFAQLSSQSRNLARAIQQDGRDISSPSSTTLINFQDPASSRALTEAILEHDFGLHVTLRPDRLCPPVPNRLNYIAWLQEILEETQQTAQCISSHFESEKDDATSKEDSRPSKRLKKTSRKRTRILDVGTGSTCIYPLLGSALHDWEFIATDTDAESLETARGIVDDPKNNNQQSNGRLTLATSIRLEESVHLILRNAQDNLIPLEEELPCSETLAWPLLDKGLLYHIAMCNPPFYSSYEELQESLDLKARSPSAICQGSKEEMICEGGEVGFITRLIKESHAVARQVLWFTSMIGKLSSVGPLTAVLKAQRIDNYLLTEFVQGRTRRWAIAWSHQPYRMARVPMVTLPHSLQQYSTSTTQRFINFTLENPTSKDGFLSDLEKHLDQLSIPWLHRTDTGLVVLASRDTWTRKARRQAKAGVLPQQDSSNKGIILGLQISMQLPRDSTDSNVLQVGWMYGSEVHLFESFVMSVLRGWMQKLTTPH